MVPGEYTATLDVNGRELSRSFEVRGDPALETSLADYQARTDAAFRGLELEARLRGMLDALDDLRTQIEGLQQTVRARELEDAERIRAQADSVLQEIGDLEDQLRRPPPGMGYRQYPRLSEQLSFVARGITQAQARPTEGQLEVLRDIQTAIEAREADLRSLLGEPVARLNAMLGGLPPIEVGWSR